MITHPPVQNKYEAIKKAPDPEADRFAEVPDPTTARADQRPEVTVPQTSYHAGRHDSLGRVITHPVAGATTRADASNPSTQGNGQPSALAKQADRIHEIGNNAVVFATAAPATTAADRKPWTIR